MKQTKTKELQGLSAADLGKKVVDAQENLFKLKLRKATRQLEDTSGLRSLRRDIARFKTLAAQSAKAAAPAKAAAAK
jgi:large subunit ribosomal protein L29